MSDPNPYAADDTDYVHPTDHPTGIQPTDDERNMAIIAHASGIIGVLGFGLIGFVGPLVVYLLNKDKSHYVETQAKEALNFQITLLLFGFALGAALILSCGMLFPIVLPLSFVPMVCQVVFGVLATLAVRDGKFYRYPLTFRLLQ